MSKGALENDGGSKMLREAALRLNAYCQKLGFSTKDMQGLMHGLASQNCLSRTPLVYRLCGAGQPGTS